MGGYPFYLTEVVRKRFLCKFTCGVYRRSQSCFSVEFQLDFHSFFSLLHASAKPCSLWTALLVLVELLWEIVVCN